MKSTFIDLFSGAGGMSCGFYQHPNFKVIAAVDAQIGKPSSGIGSLGCNDTYKSNIGIAPFEHELDIINSNELGNLIRSKLKKEPLTVMAACPPCTGFSRANPNNHLMDDSRNSLVGKVAIWAEELKPEIIVMENARELIKGNFIHHYEFLEARLIELGYNVKGKVYMLDRFGLPQKRERSIIIAARKHLQIKTLDDLWDGYAVRKEATYVRRAIGLLPPVAAGEKHPEDEMHVSPSSGNDTTKERMSLIPHDGGSWIDIRNHPRAMDILTPAMKRYLMKGQFGSHPDIYGRLWWDKPAVTIKRECGHTGNGRYLHPEQDRLCTVREMAVLQGFPRHYQFISRSISNMYRHIGDAVPPLISFQLACVVEWIISGKKPNIEDVILKDVHMTCNDIHEIKLAKQEVLDFICT